MGSAISRSDKAMPEGKERNPAWTRDELLLALDYYVQRPGAAHDPGSAGILRLSEEINGVARLLGLSGAETLRNPNGVSMKLLNFRAHDPVYVARARRGLPRGNKLEAELWARFAEDPRRLREIANGIRVRLTRLDDAAEAIAGDDALDVAEAEEGKIVTRLHRRRERNRALVKRKKASFRKRHGRLFCEACGFDFAKAYGPRGEDVIECHHTRPVALLTPGEKTELDDVVLLCANCHRVVHVRSDWLSIDALKALLGDIQP